jgi:alpha-mannosidase
VPANPSGDLPPAYAWASVSTDHVVLETVKKAEDEDAWIVRLYESRQYRSNVVNLTLGQSIKKAVETNLMEEEQGLVAHQGNQITFAVKPFEIKKFNVWF